MWSVIGILAALQRRTHNGRGGRVDASLYESALAWMSVPIAAYLCSGEIPQKAGSGAAQIVPYQAFAASDGHVMVAAGNDNLFRRMAAAMGRTGLAEDPRFRTNADRVRNRAALIGILEAEFARASAAEWDARLHAAGVPCGPIQTVDQVVAHEQTKALGIIQAAPEGAPALVGLPLSFDGIRPGFERRPPGLGEHDGEVLPTPGPRERTSAR